MMRVSLHFKAPRVPFVTATFSSASASMDLISSFIAASGLCGVTAAVPAPTQSSTVTGPLAGLLLHLANGLEGDQARTYKGDVSHSHFLLPMYCTAHCTTFTHSPPSAITR
jgi:hypothetical protein